LFDTGAVGGDDLGTSTLSHVLIRF
jgi:hypothetical protein